MTETLTLSVGLQQLGYAKRGDRPHPSPERLAELAEIIGTKGDALLYPSKTKGRTAHVFNAVAEAITIMSYQPGGVDFGHLHFCEEGGTQRLDSLKCTCKAEPETFDVETEVQAILRMEGRPIVSEVSDEGMTITMVNEPLGIDFITAQVAEHPSYAKPAQGYRQVECGDSGIALWWMYDESDSPEEFADVNTNATELSIILQKPHFSEMEETCGNILIGMNHNGTGQWVDGLSGRQLRRILQAWKMFCRGSITVVPVAKD
ncbi:hypothetical protein [Salininema proteolyticum]|uniref:Uncharacterized protein n=1 Tax=Salininema proteolyticum TaxID=1607685 RepID=A0ABV8TYZ9_9ACTN